MFYKSYNYLYHLIQLPTVLRNQWRSSESVTAMQNRLLRQTVTYAYKYVPYYKKLFDSLGLRPDAIRNQSDLAKIPLLTKDIIRANYPTGMLSVSRRVGRYRITETSGASGSKLQVAIDDTVLAKFRLMEFRQFYGIGYASSDKMVYLRPHPPRNFFFQKFGLFRRYFVSSLADPKFQLDEINRVRPQVLYAYPSTLYLLARQIQAESKGLDLPLKFIISNSELLTEDVRQILEETFRCKVYDDYSCLEFLAIGFECEKQNMHLASDNVVVEVLGNKGKTVPEGNEGRLVITSLNNRVMPYLRYEIGDVGGVSSIKCPCGRGFPVFTSLLGRSDDFIITRQGTLVNPRNISLIIRRIREVVEYQLIQETVDRLVVRLILAHNGSSERVVQIIRNNLETVLGAPLDISFELVSRIDRGSTGKHRCIRSMVADKPPS